MSDNTALQLALAYAHSTACASCPPSQKLSAVRRGFGPDLVEGHGDRDGIRQRIRLATARLAEAASAGDLDAAASLAGQACRDIQAGRGTASGLRLPPRQLIQATARQLHTLEMRRRQNLSRTGNPVPAIPGQAAMLSRTPEPGREAVP